MASWDDYEVFCRVAAHGGFTAAARVMKRPKSSLSASVTRLESALNVRLLERTTRVVRLTEAGEFVYGSIEPLFARLRDIRDEASALSKNISGNLRIAAPYEFSAHHLGAVACQIMAAHQQLHVQIDMVYAPISPLDERYDIVFTMADHDLPSSGIIARRVFTLEQGLFASPEFLDRHGRPERIGHLVDMPVLANSFDTEWVFFDARGGRRPMALLNPRLRSSNADVRFQAAKAGLGITRITATYCEDAVRRGHLTRVLPDIRCAPVKVYALLASRRLMPAKVRTFLDTLTGATEGHS